MFSAKYLIWFSLLNLFSLLNGDPNPPVLYAQDYCHYTTINQKIYLNEERASVIIRPSRGHYKPNLDCQLRIGNDAKNTGLNINVNYINLRQNHRFRDYLVIKFNDKKTKLWFDNRLIGNKFQKEEFFLTEDSRSDPDEITIKFTTTADNINIEREDKDFQIIITLFEFKNSDSDRRGSADQSCERRFLFDCGDNICLNRKFFCNGFNNCGNGRDEPDRCKHSRNNNYFDLFDTGFWFGFKIVMILLLIGILLGIMSCICKKYDENKKLKKQFLLEELNRNSGYRVRGNSIYQTKTPLYPQLYRTYGGTEA